MLQFSMTEFNALLKSGENKSGVKTAESIPNLEASAVQLTKITTNDNFYGRDEIHTG